MAGDVDNGAGEAGDVFSHTHGESLGIAVVGNNSNQQLICSF